MDNINNFMSWAQSSKCYEQLKVVDDINDFKSWYQGSKFYEPL